MTGRAHAGQGGHGEARPRGEVWPRGRVATVTARAVAGWRCGGLGAPAPERCGWALHFAIAVGEDLFWVRDPFTVRDMNYKMGLAFRSSLLETV